MDCVELGLEVRVVALVVLELFVHFLGEIHFDAVHVGDERVRECFDVLLDLRFLGLDEFLEFLDVLLFSERELIEVLAVGLLGVLRTDHEESVRDGLDPDFDWHCCFHAFTFFVL